MDDRAEFDSLARLHLDALFRTALRMAGDRPTAEDLVQETFIRAWRAFGRFERGSNFKAWIFTILTNVWINEYRRHARAARVTDFAEAEPAAPEEAPVLDASDLRRLGETLGDEARRALESMPPEFRIVFLLSTFEDLSYKEIAAALELPIGTVMSRLFRARQILRKELAGAARRVAP